MFLVTSIAMLRERTTGTLERLMSMPLAKIDLLAGYAIAFALMAVVQATDHVSGRVLDARPGRPRPGLARHRLRGRERAARHVPRPLPRAFAQTEFQAVQFMPAFVLPQFLLCGLLVQRALMIDVLEWASTRCRSPTRTTLERVTADDLGGRLLLDAVVVVGIIVLALALGSLTLRRRTA